MQIKNIKKLIKTKNRADSINLPSDEFEEEIRIFKRLTKMVSLNKHENFTSESKQLIEDIKSKNNKIIFFEKQHNLNKNDQRNSQAHLTKKELKESKNYQNKSKKEKKKMTNKSPKIKNEKIIKSK